MGTALAWTRGDVCSDRCRVCNFRHLRRGIPFLSWQESDRTHAKQVLEAPIFYSICLLSSSITIHLAVKALRAGNIGSFRAWWFGTIVLGAAFLYCTAHEWHRLIYRDGLTISTNLFGTTYYSLVGLHGVHVIVGLICLSLVMVFALLGVVQRQHA